MFFNAKYAEKKIVVIFIAIRHFQRNFSIIITIIINSIQRKTCTKMIINQTSFSLGINLPKKPLEILQFCWKIQFSQEYDPVRKSYEYDSYKYQITTL